MYKLKKSIFHSTLSDMADAKYRDFSFKLTPNIDPKSIMGVKIPKLRALAKKAISEDKEKVSRFLSELPHRYFDENNLHGIIISEWKNYDEVISLLEDFLPHINNWATCDVTNPKIFKKHKPEILPHIRWWMYSQHEYTSRFGIEMLMTHFLDDDFHPKYLKWVVAVQHETYACETYYVKMMIAWFFATALTKQYDDSIKILENKDLNPWTHNKTIQKARESRCISEERKAYLKTLKV